jgi:hypothetical protein
MLIQEALNLLTPSLTALSWVERFGGVTRKITKSFQDEKDGTIQKSFPISCNVTDIDCNTNQRYTELVPDNSKKSILYWEVTQEFADQGADNNTQQRRVLKGAARLVGWLNTDKLGVNKCNTAAFAMRSLLPTLYTQIAAGAGGELFEKTRIKFEYTGGSIKDKAVFDQYSYGKNVDGLLLHPYDFFAMDVSVTAYLPLCPYVFVTAAPIVCTDYSQL